MRVFRLVRFCLLMVGLLTISLPGMALAQEGSGPPPERLDMAATYPKLEAIAGGAFNFEVGLRFAGAEPRNFDLTVTAPADWRVYITPQFEKDKRISAIRLETSISFGSKVILTASPPAWPIPEPGEYRVILEVSSGELKNSVDLTAVITESYSLFMSPASGMYNTTATTGESRKFSMKVTNLGTGAIDNITFSPTNPEGWEIEFTPDKIDILEAVSEQTVDVNIKPAAKTIAGDYVVTIRASGKQATAGEVQIRVTVESPTIWGWVGVAIILLVVAGMIVIFMRFSRR